MKKVAVTGGLASGKSSVCQILKSYGAYVASADEIVHRLLSPKTEVGKKVIQEFGPDIVANQNLDRKKLAEKTFGHPERLRTLEKLLHPQVLDEIQRTYDKISHDPTFSLFVAEIPLLYESESEKLFDCVIAVIADEALMEQRFKKGSIASSDEFDKRMQRQLPPHTKAARADFVIVNNGTMDELKERVKTIYDQLTGAEL